MIQIDRVSKVVRSGPEELSILTDVELEIGSGEFVSLIGPSGSGKSTLLGLVAGLDAPTTGRVVVDGIDLSALGEDELARVRGERIGFVFQFFHLLPSLTAFENVLVPMEIAGLSDPAARTEELLREVGLSERTHHYPSQLSGGEQQRVAIARALANDPAILLADEPTGNLDASNGSHIVDLILEIHRRRGTTILLATHDGGLARRADRTISLRAGRIERIEAQGAAEVESAALGG